MIVLDASAAVRLLLNVKEADRIRERLDRSEESLHVPHLFDLEVTQTLRRYVLSGDVSDERGLSALADLSTMRLTRYPHMALVGRIWELKENVSAYDAAYVALAEALDAPLLTTDKRLSRAPGHNAEIELYGGT